MRPWRCPPWVVMAAFAGTLAPAAAQPVPAALEACARLPQDSERLACFDREVAAASGNASTGTTPAAATPPAPVAQTAAPANSVAASPPAAAAPAAASAAATGAVSASPSVTPSAAAGTAPGALTPEQKLGLSLEGIRNVEARQGIKSEELKELSAHIVSVSRNAAGRQVFTLDNGQVWRQSETRPTFVAGAGDAISITHGAFGSFWLATSKHNWTRVERLP